MIVDPEMIGEDDYRFDTPLPPGKYRFTVLDVEETLSSNNNPMVVLTLGVKGPSGGVRVMDRRVLTLKARNFYTGMLKGIAPWLLLQVLTATINKKTGVGSPVADVDHRSMIDRKGVAHFVTGTFNDVDRPEVKSYVPHGELQEICGEAFEMLEEMDTPGTAACPF